MKTTNHTRFQTRNASQQPFAVSAIVVPPSRGSTIREKRAHQQRTTAAENTSSARENDHLPSIRHPPAASVIHQQSRNDLTSNSTVEFVSKYNKAPIRLPKQYPTKPMSTATSKKPTALVSNGAPSRSNRTYSSDSDKRVRKFWWAPRRNEIEIRSDHDNAYRNVSSKVDSLSNIEYRPGGGQVSIRDEPIQWQAGPKVGSLSNANWAPPPPRVNVKSEKLQWTSQSKVDSLANIDYKPTGSGNVAIRDEKSDFSHITPRVDCGFVE